MMGKTWILVAHEAGARLFANDGIGNGLALVESIDHPEGRARDRDIDSDRPGRSFRKNSGDPRRASMGQSESPHDRVVSDFCERASRQAPARAVSKISSIAWFSSRLRDFWDCCVLRSMDRLRSW